MTDKDLKDLKSGISTLTKTVQDLQGQVNTLYCVVAMLVKEHPRQPYPEITREALQKLAVQQGDRFSARNLKLVSDLAGKLP